MAIYIGLMSGTSMDGIDGVLVRFASGDGAAPVVLAHRHLSMPPALQQSLMLLNARGDDELHAAALAANRLAECCAEVCVALQDPELIGTEHVHAIGAHGQTVRHRPGEFDGRGYTLQLLNGALLAELTGIDVVCDFRSRDVAAGGQGAPLVPAFHAALWARPGQAQAVLNLGGIANLSLLHADGGIGGFDCGPGNALMDLWCTRHLGRAFDADGEWAAGGRCNDALLARMLTDPYFAMAPPKSTGRDRFHAAWLDAMLARSSLPPRDIQATLAELTVAAVAASLWREAPSTRRVMVCGGGALNGHLMRRLTAVLDNVDVRSTEALGMPVLQVEAAAFAWLARAFMLRLPGNRPEVTGAGGPRVLGALYPAR